MDSESDNSRLQFQVEALTKEVESLKGIINKLEKRIEDSEDDVNQIKVDLAKQHLNIVRDILSSMQVGAPTRNQTVYSTKETNWKDLLQNPTILITGALVTIIIFAMLIFSDHIGANQSVGKVIEGVLK